MSLPSAADMRRRTTDLSYKRTVTMDHVLQLCVRHIMKSADLEHTECAYEIPEIVLGLPLYDLGNVVSYLRDKLLSRGFRVAYIFPRVLVISWRTHEPNRRRPIEENKSPSPAKHPSPVPEPMPAFHAGVPQDTVAAALGPPKPINTSLVRSIESTSFPQHAPPVRRPFQTPYVKPIAELKPSGRFTLNLS